LTTGGGQLETETGPLAAGTVICSYDSSRRRTSRSVNSAGTFGTIFDVASRATELSAGVLGSTSVGYVPNTGRISTLTHGNGELTQLAYLGNTGDHRLSQISHFKPTGGGGYATLSRFEYAYDAAGQVTAWTQWAQTGRPRLRLPTRSSMMRRID